MVYKQLSFYTNNSIDQEYINFPIQGSLYVDRFKVLECNIPQCWQSTSSINNTLVFQVAGVTYSCVVPPGSYTTATFPTALKTAMNASKNNAFNVTYGADTRRFTVTGTAAFSLLPFSSGSTIFQTIGLPKYNTVLTGTSITCNAPDLTNNSPLLLTSSAFITKDNSFVGGQSNSMNIMAVISRASTPVGSFINYTGANSGWFKCQTEISSVDFSLLDGATLGKIKMDQQPYEVTVGILTDEDDVEP